MSVRRNAAFARLADVQTGMDFGSLADRLVEFGTGVLET
jgi:hypothetical protein